MYEAHKRAWVEALRSGNYQQAHGLLCEIDGEGEPVGYCCLGVLCDLAAKDCAPVTRRLNKEELRVEFDDSIGYLPQSVRDWANLNSDDPTVDGKPLTHWNDSDKLSFSELADLIEEHL